MAIIYFMAKLCSPGTRAHAQNEHHDDDDDEDVMRARTVQLCMCAHYTPTDMYFYIVHTYNTFIRVRICVQILSGIAFHLRVQQARIHTTYRQSRARVRCPA